MNRPGGQAMPRPAASRSTDPYAAHPILVYGTLRLGMPNDRFWRGSGGRSMLAVLRGARLYDLPFGFPAVVLDDDGAAPDEPVRGELVTCEDMLGLLLALDRLEGFRPDGPEERNHYQRVLVEVEVLSGERVLAWVYVYTPDRLGEIEGAMLVPHGDWPAWIERTRITQPRRSSDEGEGDRDRRDVPRKGVGTGGSRAGRAGA